MVLNKLISISSFIEDVKLIGHHFKMAVTLHILS